MLRVVLFALALFLTAPAHAQFVKPAGLLLPTVVVPDYNLTVSVWAVDTGFIGQYLGVFEQHNDGQWYGCTHNMGPDDNLAAEVTAAGGPQAWLATIGMAAVNEALRLCYPPITGSAGPPPPASAGVIGQVNYTLQSYRLSVVNGQAVMAGK